MFKFFKAGVNRKLIAMCLLLAVLICTGCCTGGYFMYRESTYKSYNDFAYEIGDMALSYVDGDRITAYTSAPYYDAQTKTFTPDEAYTAMKEAIYKLYINTSMPKYGSGIYVCIPERTADKEYLLTNLFDVRIVDIAEDKKPGYEVGVVDPMGVKNPEEVMKIFESGRRSSDYFVHKTKFGFNSTAILPVKNSAGETVALLMSDMPMPYVSTTLRRFLWSTVAATVLIVALFIGVFITLIRRTLTKPLRIIAEEADAFTRSEIQISERLPNITQSDEIGQLADSIYRMENDIQSYVTNLTAVTAEKERIGAELNVATQIQSSMLPCIFPAFPDRKEFEIYATMTPAKEVGGDFYDFFMVDHTHLAMVMADVSGKGVPAALFMVIGKTLLKDHTTPGRDLGEVFAEVNDLLCEANSEGLFITAFEAVLDLVTGELCFVNAGHEMPFISTAAAPFAPYKIRPGFVLAGMEGMHYKAGSMTLSPGDKLFQYTDGVTEATNSQNELYGMERLERVLVQHNGDSPEALLPAVKADVDAFVGEAPQFDDITMLCMEYRQRAEE